MAETLFAPSPAQVSLGFGHGVVAEHESLTYNLASIFRGLPRVDVPAAALSGTAVTLREDLTTTSPEADRKIDMSLLKQHGCWAALFGGCGLFLMTLGCQPAPVKPVEAERQPAETVPGATLEKADRTVESAAGSPATPDSVANAEPMMLEDAADAEVPPNAGTSGATADTDDSAPVATMEVTLGDPTLTGGIPGDGELTAEEIDAWLNTPEHHAVLQIKLPMGLSGAAANITGIDENPMTLAKIELGRQLYFDTRLSADNTISCASCHHPDEGYGKATQFGEGIGGQTGNRNSPVSYNRIVSGPQFWDGRADSLEAQAVGPIENPIEMGNTHEKCVATVRGIEGYRKQFEKIFGSEGVTIDNIGKAIATFERAIVTSPAPYDYLELVRSTERQWEGELDALEEEDPELYAKYQVALKEAGKMSESGSPRSRPLLQRKSQLYGLPRWSQFHRREVPQHRCGHGRGGARLGAFQRDPAGHRSGRLQDADLSQCGSHRTLHARWQPGDAGGSRGMVCQGRPPQSLSQREDEETGPDRTGQEGPGRLHEGRPDQ